MADLLEKSEQPRVQFENIPECEETQLVRAGDRPVTFEEFVGYDTKRHVELVGGSLVERMAAQLDHEKLYAWLFHLLGGYAEAKGLGIVLGSRTAVEIAEYQGRLPDLLFVCKEHEAIVQQKAIYGPPDLVIEIGSPNDRPSDDIALESDYSSIGVPEMWFINRKLRRVRALNLEGGHYREDIVTQALLRSASVPGFELDVAWLFADDRPGFLDVLNSLLATT